MSRPRVALEEQLKPQAPKLIMGTTVYIILPSAMDNLTTYYNIYVSERCPVIINGHAQLTATQTAADSEWKLS